MTARLAERRIFPPSWRRRGGRRWEGCLSTSSQSLGADSVQTIWRLALGATADRHDCDSRRQDLPWFKVTVSGLRPVHPCGMCLRAGVPDIGSRTDGSDCCSFWHGCGWLGVAALAHLFVRAHDVLVLTLILGLGNLEMCSKVGRWHGDNRSECRNGSKWELGPRHGARSGSVCSSWTQHWAAVYSRTWQRAAVATQLSTEEALHA